MKIGIAGPIDLRLLRDLFPSNAEMPKTYSFPLIAHLARELRSRGHEIVLFALSDQITERVQIHGERISAYICPQRRPRYQMLDFFRRERSGLRDAMRVSQCDVIHAHWTYEFASAAVQSGLPNVVTAHDVPMMVLRFARHPYWLAKPWMAITALRQAQCVTAVSPYVARQLERFLRPQRDILVVPNGVESDVFDLANRQLARAPKTTVTFASVLSGWSALKNPKTLIQAFALLRNEFGARVELRMIGEGFQDGGPAQCWAKGQRADAGIEFVGPLSHPDVLSTLADRVDVLVHPSLEEAFGMAVIEAMATGLPVIGGKDSGGIPWLLDSGKAGLLVDVKSPSSIAVGMRAMVENADLRRDLARSARRKALAEYRLDAVATPYERVLSRVAVEQRH